MNHGNDTARCPACDTELDLRRPPTGTDTSPATGFLAWLRNHYALPPMKGIAELAASGALDRWTCPHCHFAWDELKGPLSAAVPMLMLGFAKSGKSTYIASMAMATDGSRNLATSPDGETWAAFADFHATGRVLAQTHMMEPAHPIAPRSPQGGSEAAGPAAPSDAMVTLGADEPTSEPSGGDDSTSTQSGLWGGPIYPSATATDPATAADPAAARPLDSASARSERYRVFGLTVDAELARFRGVSYTLLLDMPGEALSPDHDLMTLLEQAPGLYKAPMVQYCLDPAHLVGLRGQMRGLGLSSGGSVFTQVPSRLRQLAQVRSQALAGGVPYGHLAIVLLKGDVLEQVPGFPARAMQHFERSSPEHTWKRLQEDSSTVRAWLSKEGDPGLVALAENLFPSVSYHAVTATGCADRVDADGRRRFPRVEPRRVLDPVHYYYLMRYGGFGA